MPVVMSLCLCQWYWECSRLDSIHRGPYRMAMSPTFTVRPESMTETRVWCLLQCGLLRFLPIRIWKSLSFCCRKCHIPYNLWRFVCFPRCRPTSHCDYGCTASPLFRPSHRGRPFWRRPKIFGFHSARHTNEKQDENVLFHSVSVRFFVSSEFHKLEMHFRF